MNSLHYKGDCTDIDPQHYVGPDRFGAFYRPVAAEFDGTRTRIDYLPIPPAELPEFANDHVRQAMDRVQIAGLCGGDL